MAVLAWDQEGQKLYETGTDRGVLYLSSATGYAAGVAWNGLTKVTESPDGAEESPLYADNSKYLGLMSAENFKGTIEAYTYPDEFAEADGSVEAAPGVSVAMQTRKPFAFAYRTLLGNDKLYNDYGYKLHLIWGAKVSPSERGYETVNDSPSALTFSWKFTTTPVDIPGFKKSATLVIDSSKVDPAKLKTLEDTLYGTADKEPAMPTPAEVIAMFPASTGDTGSGTTTNP